MMKRLWQGCLHRLTIFVVLSVFLFDSCDGDDDASNELPPAEITGISPTSARKETVVEISGNNFGTDQSKIKVLFNEKEATINSLTNTLITAVVPSKAGTGVVKVILSGKESVGPLLTYIPSFVVSTLAGDGTFGFANGNGAAATFESPLHICVDSKRNVFVADRNNHAIRKITPEGTVSTFAGNGTTGGDIVEPNGICVDKSDNLYVSDGCKIKKITPTGIVTILSGTQALSCGNANGSPEVSMFSYPYGMCTDDDGNVYVTDRDAHSIRKITPAGVSSTIAGGSYGDETGPALTSKFRYPHDVDIDSDGNIFILDQSNFKIKKISAGAVSTFVGSEQGHVNAIGALAKLDIVNAFCIEHRTGLFYFLERTQDTDSVYLRTITPEGNVTTLFGTLVGHADGLPSEAKLNVPYGIAVDSEGSLYISESYPRIRKITIE